MEFRYKDTTGVGEDELKETAEQLEPYLKRLREVVEKRDYSTPEASLCLPGDEAILAEVKRMLERHPAGKLKYIFLIGIGGSNLGTRALYDALRGPGEIFDFTALPKIIFLDTISARELEVVLKLIELFTSTDDVLVNIVSKSGMTLETIANAEIVLSTLKKKFIDTSRYIVVTTDKSSSLDAWANDADADALYIPQNVGGRYSVLSPVGLFPLGLCGFDIESFLKGANDALETCLAPESPAALSACAQFLNYKKGKTISDHFFFVPELESLGKWCRQLIAESLGKEKDLEGNMVNTGITPTVSIGSTDLHSMVQLYLGGPKNKYTNFITTEGLNPVAIPQETSFKFLDANIAGKSADSLLGAIVGGVKAAYLKAGLPFSETILRGVSEHDLGEYMQFKMIETMLVGKLMNINAFDQPAVEDYKIETRKLLN